MRAVTQRAISTAGRFRIGRDRGRQYLMEQLRPDGGFGPEDKGVADYYKAIAALHVCGETHSANRLCQWIRRHGITAEGDFGPRPADMLGHAHAYYNSWVVLGAHRLGHYDIAERGMDFLMRFYDAETGGFYSSPTERTAETLEEIWIVCGSGRAALATGRIDVAEGVGRWLKEVMRQQPQFPQKLYGVFSRAKGLHTAVEPGNELRYVADKDAQRDQFFFNPGIAAGLLCRLYQATGKSEWLDLARDYMRFVEGASDYLFHSLRAGKVAWAASNLYTLTGQAKYREMAIRIGDAVLETQAEDGSWDSMLGPDFRNDVAAEMTYWLDQIFQAVGDGPAI